MKITSIDLYQLDIPLKSPMIYPHKTYYALDDTIVRITTDSGLVGWGERAGYWSCCGLRESRGFNRLGRLVGSHGDE